MEVESVRAHCRSFPHTTEHLQWGADLVFKVGGKMYAVLPLEPAPVWISFKCSDETFAELVEMTGLIPAPYLARAKWVAIECKSALPPVHLKRLLSEAYALVLAKLPKRTQELLRKPAPRKHRKPSRS